MLPKVSINIPTYNQQDFIERAINSALAQDYANLEIIIADDCSTDTTKSVVEKYLKNPAVKYFRNELNIGRTATYKKALEDYASGEWVVNLDGDDYYTDPHFISDSMALILSMKNKNIVFAQAGHEQKKLQDPTFSILNLPNMKNTSSCIPGTTYFLNFFKLNHFSHAATLYRRKEAIEIGFYTKNILSSDINSLLKLALHGDVLLIKKNVAVWLKHEHNASGSSDFKQSYENIVWIQDCAEYAKKFIERKKIEAWIKTAKRSFLLGLTHKMCEPKNFHSIKNYLKELWGQEKQIFGNLRFIRLLILGLFKSLNQEKPLKI
jgi:glycosyltransferase involved in cell wall biosynthesis